MAPGTTLHLPNGHNLTVSPVFGGVSFKPNEWTSNHSHFPAGWTVIINSEDGNGDGNGAAQPYAAQDTQRPSSDANHADSQTAKGQRVHRFRQPTLQGDHLYISSISNPSSAELKSTTSPTRQIAMMLWTTLWWYFHQPPPNNRVTTSQSIKTPEAGKPRGEWRIHINREGVFKGRVVLPKLERMGLISSENSSVGLEWDERGGEGWEDMFVSRRAFWQLDPRIYLYNLMSLSSSPYPSGSPYPSRPASPNNSAFPHHHHNHHYQQQQQAQQQSQQQAEYPQSHHKPSSDGNPPTAGAAAMSLWSPTQGPFTQGPFQSSSHMPTYYPPPPTQYVMTNGIRHPMRPKPPRQGETFYTRYIPSIGQYLSFRVASLSPKATVHRGPVAGVAGLRVSQLGGAASASLPSAHMPDFLNHTTNSHSSLDPSSSSSPGPSDIDLLHKWMNLPRVADSWLEDGPRSHQESFLKAALSSRHSVPVIGCWDGKPFGYFEIYWVQEDNLGRHMSSSAGAGAGAFDRGLHVLVGEQEFRGADRVRVWLSALVHYCWLVEPRTETVVLEPRVDNAKIKGYLEDVGFYKEREVSFPHKQASLMRIRRDAWEAPVL